MNEQRRAYQKAYYQRNRERLLAQQKERGKRNYQANPDYYKAKSQRWREANPDRHQQSQQRYQETNRERTNQRSRDWYAANKARASAQARRQKLARYGLTEADYEEMLAAQGGGCMICGSLEAMKGRPDVSFRVDHDHTTGAVRGLLCAPCNSGLGHFKDNPDLLMRAAAYLTRLSSGATSTTSSERSSTPSSPKVSPSPRSTAARTSRSASA